MQKRYLALCLVFIMLACSGTALAAGKLTITQENVLVLPYDTYFVGALYLEAQNTGDKAVQMNGGLFELMDASGNVVSSLDLKGYDLWPEVLQPGEFGYISKTVDLKEATSSDYVGSYSADITGKGAISADITRFAADARYETGTNSDGTRKDYIVAVITNHTDKTIYDFDVGFEFLDEAGTLLFTTTGYWAYTGILPNSSIEVYLDVPENVTAYWVENNIVPASANAIAFITDYR
jgi:hypothetical protein